MSVKDGAAHLRALDKDREVYLDGALITRVADHPAFAAACRSAAALYDFQAAEANVERMTFETGTGRRVNLAWQMPRSYAELVARREALTAWAELHGGFLGRSPDHLASSITGQVMGIEVFERHGVRFANALRDYYAYARDNDLYLTYLIINPQGDRSKAWGEQASEEMTMRVVDEDTDGVTVRGAKMLGTGSVMAEEILVANLQPLKPGEERFAISFALPLDARGLKVLSRKSYEASATSPWDNPLSHRFDENDSVVYFDDVKVPWERIFLLGDTDMCRAQFHDTPGHVFQNYQSQIRLVVKLKFLLAVARRIAETIGTVAMAPVREQLGEMASEVATVEGLLYGMESAGGMIGDYYVPNASMMYAAQVQTQALYPRIIDRDTLTRRRWLDYAAVIGCGPRQPGDRAPDRAYPGLRAPGRGRFRTDGADEARLGRGGLRIRRPPHPVRDVLRGRQVRHHPALLQALRLGRRRPHPGGADGQQRSLPPAVRVAVVNLGAIVSGDWRAPFVDGEALIAADGILEAVGTVEGAAVDACDVVIDAGGATAIPGLIDSQVHVTFGDFTPRQNTVGYLTSYVHGGTTTAISASEVHVPGRPKDPAGVKALAVAAFKCFEHYRPGGMRVHGGSIILEPGLTRADFDDVHRDGVWLAKAGFGAVETARDYVALVRHAREAGLLTTLHTGGASIPGSFPITGEDLIAIDPTVSFHINGGPVAIEDRYFEQVAAETGIAMQVCTAGNLRTTLLCAEAARKHDAFDRFLIATDTPTGSGVMPLGMIYTMVNIASLAGFDPTWMIAASTGNVAEIYGLNSGFLRPGRDADVVIIDAPLGATKPDALTTMSNGDPVAIGAVITDGIPRFVGRSRNTPPTTRKVAVTRCEVPAFAPS